VAEDDDTPKNLLDKARDEVARAAAKHAAKAAFDEAGRRARDAVDGALGEAEQWVGREAASAEARREASGLPSTTQEAHWSDALATEGEAAFQRARQTVVEDEEAEAREREERTARAREELARMKAALRGGGDPLLDEARKTLQKASALRESAPVQDDASLEAELDALAAEAAADAGSVTPDDEEHVPTEAHPAGAQQASEARAPAESQEASRPTLAPADPTVVTFDDEPDPEPTAGDAAFEDPAMAVLARAAAARQAASDDEQDQAMSALEAELGTGAPQAPAEPAEDPAVAALAAARQARADAGHLPDDAPLPGDDPTGLDAAERALARARQARGGALDEAARELDQVRAQARARAERIAQEAMAGPPTPDLPVVDPADNTVQTGAPAPELPPRGDPLSAAEQALARAREARSSAGTTTDAHEEARRRARERIARLTAAPSEPAEPEGVPLVGLDDDPMARARAALEKAAGSRGSDELERAQNLKRAREQLRQRAWERSAADLAREVLEQQGQGPDAEKLAAEALAESERLRAEQEAIAEKARRKAEAYGEAMARRAAAARQEIEEKIASRTAWMTSTGTPEERTQAALDAAAAARALAQGHDPEREAAARLELDRLKKAQAQRSDAADASGAPAKADLLGAPEPPSEPDADEPDEPDESETDEPGDPVPKRRL